MDGENGDDILVSGQGVDQNFGRQGFDWVSFTASKTGVVADLALDADAVDVPATEAGLSRYKEVEALSGSRSDDVLKGDDTAGNAPATAGLVNGLENLLGATPFGGGNIILGGRGSDIIEGRGGNDFIDGDAALNVRLTGNTAGAEIVREISLPANGRSDVDTAVFSDVEANYSVTVDDTGVVTVAHLDGSGADGTDTLQHIEQLQFADTTIALDGSSPGGGMGGDTGGGPGGSVARQRRRSKALQRQATIASSFPPASPVAVSPPSTFPSQAPIRPVRTTAVKVEPQLTLLMR